MIALRGTPTLALPRSTERPTLFSMAFSMFALSSVRPIGKYRPGRRNAELCRTSHAEPPTRGEWETHNQPDPILHAFLGIWPAFQKSVGRSGYSGGGLGWGLR